MKTLTKFFRTERTIADLFDPYVFLDLKLKNRIVMSSMTRYRAGEGSIPLPSNKEYYKQRSGAGLIISETLSVSQNGLSSYYSQGLWNSQQTEKWKEIVEEVHSSKSSIFAQLGHGGPISHHNFNGGVQPISPNGINPHSTVLAQNGRVETEDPRLMTKDDFKIILEQFVAAGHNAKSAGFDGVQVHATSAVLLDQLLRGNLTPEVRVQAEEFFRSLFTELKKIYGDRVGVKISPTCTFNNIYCSNPYSVILNLTKLLTETQVKYVEIKYGEENEQHIYSETPTMQIPAPHRVLKSNYEGGQIIANLPSVREAYGAFINDEVDMISFGKYWISNPDLAERLSGHIGLTDPNEKTYYTQDEKGFTDYPTA
jgi:N-ethylmaleimide reductase